MASQASSQVPKKEKKKGEKRAKKEWKRDLVPTHFQGLKVKPLPAAELPPNTNIPKINLLRERNTRLGALKFRHQFVTGRTFKNRSLVPKARSQIRLHVRAVFIGYRRSHHAQKEQWALLRLENVNRKHDAEFYIGKKVAFCYYGYNNSPVAKEHKLRRQKELRVIWGRISRTHGKNGVVRARFKNNLPSSHFGSRCKVYLYPSRI